MNLKHRASTNIRGAGAGEGGQGRALHLNTIDDAHVEILRLLFPSTSATIQDDPKVSQLGIQLTVLMIDSRSACNAAGEEASVQAAGPIAAAVAALRYDGRLLAEHGITALPASLSRLLWDAGFTDKKALLACEGDGRDRGSRRKNLRNPRCGDHGTRNCKVACCPALASARTDRTVSVFNRRYRRCALGDRTWARDGEGRGGEGRGGRSSGT